jgi:hypothetical protein
MAGIVGMRGAFREPTHEDPPSWCIGPVNVHILGMQDLRALRFRSDGFAGLGVYGFAASFF